MAEFPSSEFARDPYRLYRDMLPHGPVARLKDGNFLIVHHQAAQAVLGHPEVFGSWRPPMAALIAGRPEAFGPPLANVDPPNHGRLRSLAFRLVSPGSLRQLEPMIRETIRGLIEGLADRQSVEFVSEFARPLPSIVIHTLLGLPLTDIGLTQTWTDDYHELRTMPGSIRSQACQRGVDEFATYMQLAVLKRLATPRNDGLSELASVVAAKGASTQEAVAVATSLLVGATVTTAHQLANTMLLLVQHPEQMATIAAERRRVRRLLEEALRLESSLQYVERRCLQDTAVMSCEIPRGARAFVLLGAANRDGRIFTSPDEFDASRENLKHHLSFGHGIHTCVGAPLARLEIELAVSQLLSRTTNIRLSVPAEELDYVTATPNFRGVRCLRLEFDAA